MQMLAGLQSRRSNSDAKEKHLKSVHEINTQYIEK